MHTSGIEWYLNIPDDKEFDERMDFAISLENFLEKHKLSYRKLAILSALTRKTVMNILRCEIVITQEIKDCIENGKQLYIAKKINS